MMPANAMQQLRHYCAYQERCHSEVRNKCLELGLRGQDVDEAIAALIADNFLNEERFARLFAGGKFRSKQWGRKKIEAALKLRQVSAYCIRKGIQEIDEEDYAHTLRQLTEKKYASLKGEHMLKRRFRTIQYLMQKGFERELIADALEEIASNT